ncbi:MAG: ABC transporter permease [Bacteroidia bacterium]
MITNYLKIAFRNLIKHKGFSFINISGLAIGMAACLLILQYVRFELSYDTFHEKGNRIYRLQQNRYDQGKLTTQWAAGTAGIGKLIKENFPGVEAIAKATKSRAVTSYKDKIFREEKIYYANAGFLSTFSYKLLKGDAATALKEPFSLVLTQSTARKYFGDENPMGKIIVLNNNAKGQSYKVTAVLEDMPENTHFKFNVLLSFANFVMNQGPESETNFEWDGYYTYALLKPGTDVKALEAKINVLAQKQLDKQTTIPGNKIEFKLQPLKDIHLHSQYMMEAEVNGDGKTVSFLKIIAVFIALIAWINYINLSTARSVDRAKEVGVRKVMGSQRQQLVLQFMLESVLINLLAVGLCLLLILVSLPLFNSLTGKELGYSLFKEPSFWSAQFLLFIIGALFSGLYPAVAISSFMPIEVLKGKLARNSRGAFLRKALVIVQFASSVALIIGTFCVYRQLSFMRHQDLGMNIDQMLVLRGPNVFDSVYAKRLHPFMTELENIPGISKVTVSSSVPGRKVEWNAGGIHMVGEGMEKSKQYRPIGIDYNFIDAYGLKILKGRNFSKQFSTDEEAAIVNEEAAKELGFSKPEEALNKQIDFWGQHLTIIGLVSNHHQESLKEMYDAHIYRLGLDRPGFYSLKLSGSKSEFDRTISAVKTLWGKQFPENPFDYFFLDEHFEKQYNADKNFGKTFALFAVLAIIIACM